MVLVTSLNISKMASFTGLKAMEKAGFIAVKVIFYAEFYVFYKAFFIFFLLKVYVYHKIC